MAVYDKCGKPIKSSVREDFARGLQKIMKHEGAEFADGTFEDNMVDIYDNYVSQYYADELEEKGGVKVAQDWFRDTYYDDDEGIFIHNSRKPIKSSNTSNDYGFHWSGEYINDKDGNHWYFGDYINGNTGIEPYSSYIQAVKATADAVRDSFWDDEIADPEDYAYQLVDFAVETMEDPGKFIKEYEGFVKSSRKQIKSSRLIESKVEIDDDAFIDMLWDRVNSFTPAERYDEEFWTECFDYLSDIGWTGDPWKNNPKYIVDNIAVNGEIFALEDCADNYDEINEDYKGDVNAWIEDNGYLVFGDYVVINLGL